MEDGMSVGETEGLQASQSARRRSRLNQHNGRGNGMKEMEIGIKRHDANWDFHDANWDFHFSEWRQKPKALNTKDKVQQILNRGAGHTNKELAKKWPNPFPNPLAHPPPFTLYVRAA